MKQELKKQEHIYGIDLLRILCMFMICLVHVLGNGGVLAASAGSPARMSIVYFLHVVSTCGVDCYALISGYVGLNAGRKYTNLVMLWIEVVFYNIISTVLFAELMPGSVGQNDIFKALFPFTCSTSRWYFRAYMGVFVLMPILNTAVKNIRKRRMAVCIFAFFCLCFILTASYVLILKKQFGLANNILSLSMLYLTGAFFREYGFPKKLKKRHYLICYSVLTVLMCGVTVFGPYLPGKLSLIGTIGEKTVDNMSPTIIICSICLLALFVQIKDVPCKKFVKTLGGLTFGIYLVHTDPLFYNLIMKDLFVWAADEPAVLTFLYSLLIAAAIFIISGCIEYLRSKLFGLLHIWEGLQNLENRITTKVKL